MVERYRSTGHDRSRSSRPYYERTARPEDERRGAQDRRYYSADEDRPYGRRGAEQSQREYSGGGYRQEVGRWRDEGGMRNDASDQSFTPWNERFDRDQFSGWRNRAYSDYDALSEEPRNLERGFGANAGFTTYAGRPEDLPGGRYYDGTRSTWEPSPSSFRGRGPKGYARSDERLQELVCERLTDDPRIDASEITVTVANQIVKLSGTVPDRRTKYEVEDLIERCGGVTDIDNQLRISKEATSL